MKRDLPEFFLKWKSLSKRKPLILKGARQVGKTTCLKEFGRVAFTNTHYFNFERQKSLHKFFIENSNPDSILDSLSLFSGQKINVNQDLIIFDEIQECPSALTSLKYFCEEKPSAYLMCAGSLLGVKLSEESFPVGKVEIHQLYPLSFSEFVIAIGDESLSQAILEPSEILSVGIEEKVFDLFKHYCITGGLPEIVQTYIEEKNSSLFSCLSVVREKQKILIETYENDMAKHSGKLNSMHIRRVWEDVPRQLSRVQGKFQFKNVIPGKKSYADLAAPLDWLLNAGLLIQSSIVNEAQVPLKSYIHQNQFRLFCFDVGILGALSDFPFQALLELENESLIFKGHFLENFIAQTFNRYGFSLYTWMHNTSEIEFLVQNQNGNIVAVEVKSKISSKAKSLSVFLEKYPNVKDFMIFSLNLKTQGRHYPITSIEKKIFSDLKARVPQTVVNS